MESGRATALANVARDATNSATSKVVNVFVVVMIVDDADEVVKVERREEKQWSKRERKVVGQCARLATAHSESAFFVSADRQRASEIQFFQLTVHIE